MIDFCNYKWTTEMEGGRIIHPAQPWMWYDEDAVYIENGTAELTAYRDPITIKYWDGRVLSAPQNSSAMDDTLPRLCCQKARNYGQRFGLSEKVNRGLSAERLTLWKDGHLTSAPPYHNRLILCRVGTLPLTFTGKRMTEVMATLAVDACRFAYQQKNPSKNFIKYEVEWRPNTITFYANGKRVRCYGWDVAQYIADKKMRVVFNIWTTRDQTTLKQFSCDSPMKIRNFTYKPIEML